MYNTVDIRDGGTVVYPSIRYVYNMYSSYSKYSTVNIGDDGTVVYPSI